MLQVWWSGEAGCRFFASSTNGRVKKHAPGPQAVCTIGHRWPGTQAGLRCVPEFLIFVYRNNGQVFFNR